MQNPWDIEIRTKQDWLILEALYTQYLTDTQKDLKQPTLRITLDIARQTLGFQKREDMISRSQFEARTSMKGESITRGITDGQKRGLFHRRPIGLSAAYSLILPDSVVEKYKMFSSAYPHIPESRQQPGTVADNSYPQSDGENSPKVDTQKLSYVTGGNFTSKLVAVISVLTAIVEDSKKAGAYPLQRLEWWARRVINLGWNDGDLWELWRKCKATATTSPVGLLMNRLSDDGTDPVPRKVKGKAQTPAQAAIYREFRLGLT